MSGQPADHQFDCLQPAKLDWVQFGFWLPPCLIHSVALAWLSVLAERHFAPWLLLPAFLGFVVGVGCVVLVRFFQFGHRRAAWCGVALSALTLIGGQHHFHFRVAQQQAQERWKADQAWRAQVAAAFPETTLDPQSPPPRRLTSYLLEETRRGRPLVAGIVARGAAVWLSWLLDAAAVLLGAWVGARPLLSRPYCRACRSWYRTTRAGHLGEARLMELAGLAAVSLPVPSGPGHYRMRNCRSGCGPLQLTLSWHGAKAAPVAIRPGKAVVWLLAGPRRSLGELLDQWQIPAAAASSPTSEAP